MSTITKDVTPEHHDRTEGRIIGKSGNQLACTRTQDHGMNGDAVDPRLGTHGTRPLQDFRSGVVHRALAGQVQAHTADIRFVQNVG